MMFHYSATKLFFDKEKSSDEIHLANNSSILSTRDLSIQWGEVKDCWKKFLIRDSSGNYVPIAELLGVTQLSISGRFMTTNRSPGVMYEIVYVINLEEHANEWKVPVNFKLTLPEGITHYRTENLLEKPRGEWIETIAGEVIVEPNKFGELEFSLYQHDKSFKSGLFIKGVAIRPKAR